MKKSSIIGRVHSVETFGTLDGPGIRYVTFMQGCPLRCKHCHNPDTFKVDGGKNISVLELAKDISKYKSFIGNGGVTFSGGEPLLQSEFIEAMIDELKKQKLHCAIDTSGAISLSKSKVALDKCDLVLLDVKAINDELHTKFTGVSNKNTIATLNYLKEINKPIWIRHVIIPGVTSNRKDLEELAVFLKDYTDIIEKIELIPFHKMGEFKWKELGLKYEYTDVLEPSIEQMRMAREIFRNSGISDIVR